MLCRTLALLLEWDFGVYHIITLLGGILVHMPFGTRQLVLFAL